MQEEGSGDQEERCFSTTNPQNQNLREESIFKGNDVSGSSKVQQGQNLERAKPDSGHRSDISQVASPQNRDPR